MTIVLDQGLRFTSSNNILILSSESVASDGASARNSSALGIQLTPTFNVNINDVPHVGRPFFSAAYIMVDLDSETWTLWQANATTDTRLVEVGGDCTNDSRPDGISNGTSINEKADADDSSSSSSIPTASAGTTAPLNTGAIVGIAVGAASGAGLIAGAIAIFLLRHRRQKVCSSSESAATLTGSSPKSNRRFPMWHEQPGDSVQELSALRVYQYELPVRE